MSNGDNKMLIYHEAVQSIKRAVVLVMKQHSHNVIRRMWLKVPEIARLVLQIYLACGSRLPPYHALDKENGGGIPPPPVGQDLSASPSCVATTLTFVLFAKLGVKSTGISNAQMNSRAVRASV